MPNATKLTSPPHTTDGNCPVCSPYPPPQHPDLCGHWDHFHLISEEHLPDGQIRITWACDICYPSLVG